MSEAHEPMSAEDEARLRAYVASYRRGESLTVDSWAQLFVALDREREEKQSALDLLERECHRANVERERAEAALASLAALQRAVRAIHPAFLPCGCCAKPATRREVLPSNARPAPVLLCDRPECAAYFAKWRPEPAPLGDLIDAEAIRALLVLVPIQDTETLGGFKLSPLLPPEPTDG